ncbi:WD40 repeat-containing protein [Plasmopara halstedii]|uniref:WD40 repeat-containing protein n=1 Tax=Plasmopara halstedii TaxID=4781 RepID=A0A0P1AM80_PLAHL|nr:WD40 repeat-containing protein [Plasmopara halstedii]CEG42425.1 WD40 repeat-containing protein [Plasmopara halstedii]|eukprot:XP_024578794.1 WD40 repeat-containing protein [Plasmopara halstedii]
MKEVTISETSSLGAQTYMQIQPDWSNACEFFWLDVYKRNIKIAPSNVNTVDPDEHLVAEVQSSPSIQYQLPLSIDEQTSSGPHYARICNRDISKVEIEVAQQDKTSIKKLRTIFQAPNETVDIPSSELEAVNKQTLQLYTVDVSQDERYVVVGGTDGACMLWDKQNRAQMLPLKGHVADVTRARFFPSSKVVLTGSLDLTLRIWSVQGRCAAVMKGHLGGIEDVVILGRGRNVLSCGNDGLIQLWNCGTQDAIAKWANDDQSPVHCLSVMHDAAQLFVKGDSQPHISENEAETDGKVFYAGLDNGEMLGVDIRARAAVLNLENLAGSILSCAATTATASVPMLFTGSEDGLLTVWDLRHFRTPLHALSRSSAPIHSVVVSALYSDNNTSSGSIWTAHGDGVCSKWSNLGETPHVSTELTGPQYDAVRGVAIGAQSGRIFTACRDGRLREYSPL